MIIHYFLVQNILNKFSHSDATKKIGDLYGFVTIEQFVCAILIDNEQGTNNYAVKYS